MKFLLQTFLFALVAASPSFAASILVSPASQNVGVGSQFAVSLQVSGLGNSTAPSIGTFDLNLAFDSALLSFVSATYGKGLDVLALGSIKSTLPGADVVNLFELSLDTAADLNNLQPEAFLLATLIFEGLANGTSPLALSVNALGDADGTALSATLIDGSVTVGSSPGINDIPEPSPRAILALGLAAILFLRRA